MPCAIIVIIWVVENGDASSTIHTPVGSWCCKHVSKKEVRFGNDNKLRWLWMAPKGGYFPLNHFHQTLQIAFGARSKKKGEPNSHALYLVRIAKVSKKFPLPILSDRMILGV